MRKIIILLIFFIINIFADEYINSKDIDAANHIFINKAKNKLKEEEKIDYYNLEYIESDIIVDKLKNIKELQIFNLNNSIVLIGNENNINKAKKIIKYLDKSKKQIMLNINIIDTSNNLFDRIGFNWKINELNINVGNILSGFINGSLSFTNILNMGGDVFGVDIDALKENGEIYLQSVPSILVLDGEKGLLKITEEIIIGEKKETNNKVENTIPFLSEAGIIIDVFPKIKIINNSETVLLELKIELSNFKLKGGKQQNILNTTVLLKDGSSTFVGGVFNSNTRNNNKNVPLLSDIPILGYLFKYENKNKETRDLYIEVTANIVGNE